MEDKLNHLGKIEKNKNPLTVALGLCFGVFGALLLILGALFAFAILQVLGMIGGILLAVVGCILLIIGGIWTPKIYRKEKIQYEKTHAILEQEIEEITKEAMSLVRGKDEPQNTTSN